MLQLQSDILEMVARGDALDATGRALCSKIELMLPDVVCSIVSVDVEGNLHPIAAPSLPDAFREAFDGMPTGPCVGTCGAAIYQGRPIETRDIASDPCWAAFVDLALALGLRACWSTPIKGRDGTVLGALALYFRRVRGHTPREAEIVRTCSHLFAIAMERDQQAAAHHRLAYRDMLTGMPNRAAFDVASEKAAAWSGAMTALLIVDLDNLKVVNDTFGHHAGDRLIQCAAQSIQRGAAPHRAFRMGGDEFAVVIGGQDATAAGLDRLAGAVLQELSEVIDCGGQSVQPRATVGGAFGTGSWEALRQNADFALYHAKDTLRGGFVAYSPNLGSRMTRRLGAIRDVDVALQEDRIDAHYQPIVRVDTGEIVGLEALFRVIMPDGRAIAAGDYFEATSDVHTANRLTHRMVNIVARDVRAWLDQGIWFQHVGINAASTDFQNGNLLNVIETAFGHEDVSLEHVILEVTESVYMGQDGEAVVRQVQAMRSRGLRVALDDFGTGFASLTHLLTVPVDIIKIDKSFVARMEPDSRASAIVEGLFSIAARLGLKVVAEGIETDSQARQLRAFGCTLGQGYLYSRAVDRQAITRLLLERAQKRDPDVAPLNASATPMITPPEGAPVVRYAVLLCGAEWRVVSERRQFGRFSSRSAAFQCALRLAREANASGAAVELLHADGAGELRLFQLEGADAPRAV